MKSLAADFKKRAWEALRPHYWLAFVASLIASFLGGAGSSGGGSFSFNNVNLEAEGGELTWDALYAQLGELLPIILITTFVATGIGLAFQIFVGNVVEVGYRRFYLDLVDRRPLSLGQLFVYFRHYSGVVVTQLLRRLFIFAAGQIHRRIFSDEITVILFVIVKTDTKVIHLCPLAD